MSSVIRDMDAESPARAAYVRNLNAGAHIHVSGVCGTGMAAVATLLRDLGFVVTGSDKAFYPPMGDVVRGVCQRIFTGYDSGNLQPHPDLVVIGNSLSRGNPEVEYVLEQKLAFASMPEVFAGLLIGSREDCRYSVVIAGTHGKTTTSAAVTVVLESTGLKPGYFIGGAPRDLGGGIRAVDRTAAINDRVVVLEGDEYDSAFFAKWPKFHSYRPDILVATSLEFDHADIYQSVEEIEAEFLKVFRRVPADGMILVCRDDARLAALVRRAQDDKSIEASFRFYGEDSSCDYRLVSRQALPGQPEGFQQELVLKLVDDELLARTKLSGPHNALNLLASAAVAHRLGRPKSGIIQGIERFQGVRRRQQVIFEGAGVTAIEDFAHHPTAVDVTLQGIRESNPGKRIIAAFEPRSNTSRRGFFQAAYATSFSSADEILLLAVASAGGYSGTSNNIVPLDVGRLAREITAQGRPAKAFSSVAEMQQHLLSQAQSGDVIVLMSNGDFGGLPASLATGLRQKFGHIN